MVRVHYYPFKNFRVNFVDMQEMKQAVMRILTLIFSGKPQIKSALIKFFTQAYFKHSTIKDCADSLQNLIEDSNAADLTCIEEIVP